MITSILRYPKGDRYIQIHQSLLAACDGNACAAALIRFLEQFHRYKVQQKEYTELYNVMAKEAGLGSILDTSGWQYHTYEQLKVGVMIYSEDSIRSALKLLEVKGFVSTEVPERLRILHKTGRTQWFLLMADKVNAFLDSYELSLRPKKLTFPPKGSEKKAAKKDVEWNPITPQAEMAERVFEYKSRRRMEFWRKRGKAVRETTKDADTLVLIMNLLKTFKPEELAYAVEGNLASPHHQGDNDRQTVYDDIVRHVFKDAPTVRRNIGYAEQAGVNFAKVAYAFHNGQPKEPAKMPPSPQLYESLANVAQPYLEDTHEDYPRTADAFRNVRAKIEPFEPARLERILRKRLEDTAGVYGEVHKERLAALLSL